VCQGLLRGGDRVAHYDVFISYSREDRDKVKTIARALTQRGLHVWWDPKIKTGAGFRQEISDALTATRSVLVIWSRNSVGSRFVCDEADEGAAREILFPALIDNVDIPLGFRQIQTADLTHWRGNMNDPALKAFVDAVAKGGSPAGRAPAKTAPPPAGDETQAPEKPKQKRKPKPKQQRATQTKAYTTTGSKLRLTLFMQSLLMAAIIATAFGVLAYSSDFVFAAYRPFFIGGMGVLAFLSRFGTLEADRAAGAASLALFPRSFLALILFSLIAISPLVLEGRLYAAALEGVQVKGVEGADINGVTMEKHGERFLTSSDDGSVKLWNAMTGVELAEFKGHENWVWSADFSPDGKTIASASRDLTVQRWQANAPSKSTTLSGHRASVYDVAWQPQGEAIASSSSDNTIIIWDPASGEAMRTLTGHANRVTAIDFSPDGALLASASRDGNVRIWNWRSGARLATRSIGGEGNDVKFSKSGTMFAAAAENGRIRIWNTQGYARIADFNHGARAFAVAFIADDAEIATSGVDPVIRIWSVVDQSMRVEIKGHNDGVRGLDSNGDGTILVSGSRDNTARVWDVKTRKLITTVGHINSAIDLPIAIDTPPLFVTSQAPAPVDFAKDPTAAAYLLGKGVAIASILLLGALLIKGLLWLIRARAIARPVVVATLFAVAAYTGLLMASALPAEALSLWATLAFVPAAGFALFRWIFRATILRRFTKRRRKHAY